MASWTDTIEYLPTGEAVRPRQIMMAAEDVAAATEVNDGLVVVDPGEPGVGLALLDNVADSETLEVVVGLRHEGISAQPNHVLFASCGSRTALLEASPLHASAKRMAKIYATPVHASAGLGWAGCCCCPPHPATGVPGEWDLTSLVYPSPLHASPLHASGYITTGNRDSTAVPAAEGPAAASLPAGRLPAGRRHHRHRICRGVQATTAQHRGHRESAWRHPRHGRRRIPRPCCRARDVHRRDHQAPGAGCCFSATSSWWARVVMPTSILSLPPFGH